MDKQKLFYDKPALLHAKSQRLIKQKELANEIQVMTRTIRVKSWEEFKKAAIEMKTKTVIYVIAQSVPNRDYTGLKLILPVEGAQYIFTDTAKGNKMRKTKIPVHTDKKGNRFLTDEDIKLFLGRNLEIKNTHILSYWTA